MVNPKARSARRSKLVMIVICILVIVVGCSAAWLSLRLSAERESSINSFAECVADGRPIMESYPEQCAANGRVFSNPDQVVTPLESN